MKGLSNIFKFSEQAIILFYSVFALFSVSAYAQEDPKSTKITIFKAEDNPTKMDDKKKVILHNNIKWNWSLLGRGVFLMDYEFLINEKLTGEGGLGLTYRDPVFELFNEASGTYYFGGNQ